MESRSAAARAARDKMLKAAFAAVEVLRERVRNGTADLLEQELVRLHDEGRTAMVAESLAIESRLDEDDGFMGGLRDLKNFDAPHLQ